jgi:hypothetical protein
MSKLARSFLPIVVLLSCAAGCGPTAVELRTDQSCRVWIEQPIGGNFAVTVYNGEGFTVGSSRLAFFSSANEIAVAGLGGPRVLASYDRGELVIHRSLFGDYPPTITTGETTTIPGGFSPITVEHNRPCNAADVAVGAVSLFVAIAQSSR